MKRLPAAPILCSIAVVLVAGCNHDPAPEAEHVSTSEMLEVEIEGESRRALVYFPDASVERPSVVMYFHGHGGDVYDSRNRRQFHELWPEAIVAYMEGTFVDSNGANVDPSSVDNKMGWTLRFLYKYAIGQSKDIAYIKAGLQRIDALRSLDSDRIFAAGHSSGGFFTLSLMDLQPELFSGFVVLGAYARYKVSDDSSINNGSSSPLTLTAGVDMGDHLRPVLYMFGTLDSAFPNDAGSLGLPEWSASGTSLSRSTLRQLLIQNGCAVPPDDYWAGLDYRIFSPIDSAGAEVHWRLYEGTHSWSTEANELAIDFLKSL